MEDTALEDELLSYDCWRIPSFVRDGDTFVLISGRIALLFRLLWDYWGMVPPIIDLDLCFKCTF